MLDGYAATNVTAHSSLLWIRLAVAMSAAPLAAETNGLALLFGSTFLNKEVYKANVEFAISEAEPVFKGRTVVTRDEIGVELEGVVIEYFDTIGEVFCWYLGHAAILRGTWTINASVSSMTAFKDGRVFWVEQSAKRPPLELCRQIAATSDSVFPRSRLRRRDRATWVSLRDRIVANSAGDVFELSRMKTACRMCSSDRASKIVKTAVGG